MKITSEEKIQNLSQLFLMLSFVAYYIFPYVLNGITLGRSILIDSTNQYASSLISKSSNFSEIGYFIVIFFLLMILGLDLVRKIPFGSRSHDISSKKVLLLVFVISTLWIFESIKIFFSFAFLPEELDYLLFRKVFSYNTTLWIIFSSVLIFSNIISYYKFRAENDRKFITIFLFTSVLLICFSIILEIRKEILPIIFGVFFTEFSINKINKTKLSSFLIIGILFFLFFGFYRDHGLNQFVSLITNNDFNAVGHSIFSYFEYNSIKINLGGESYVNGLMSIIPRDIYPGIKPYPFAQLLDLAPSFIIEAHANFGFMGVLVGFWVGVLFMLFMKFNSYLAIILSSYIFSFFRGDFANWFNLVFLSILFIVLVIRYEKK